MVCGPGTSDAALVLARMAAASKSLQGPQLPEASTLELIGLIAAVVRAGGAACFEAGFLLRGLEARYDKPGGSVNKLLQVFAEFTEMREVVSVGYQVRRDGAMRQAGGGGSVRARTWLGGEPAALTGGPSAVSCRMPCPTCHRSTNPPPQHGKNASADNRAADMTKPACGLLLSGLASPATLKLLAGHRDAQGRVTSQLTGECRAVAGL